MASRSLTLLSKIVLSTIFMLTLTLCKAQITNNTSVHFESIRELFENEDDSLLQKEHTWSYKFTHKKQNSLNKLYEELNKKNFYVEKVQNGGNCYFIKLYENKTYTPELLYERIQHLNLIANKFGISPVEDLGYIVER